VGDGDGDLAHGFVGGELRAARVGILRGRSLRVGGGAAVSGAAAVAGNAPLRVFRYETKQNEPAPKDPQKTSTNLTKDWQRKGVHFS
jgi:hypothetical protein